MAEAPKNIPEQVKETSQLPEAIQSMVIKSFRKLFESSEFVKKIQERITDIPEYVQRMQLAGTLNRITWLNSDALKVTTQTKGKLGNLVASFDPKKIQPYNPNTTV